MRWGEPPLKSDEAIMKCHTGIAVQASPYRHRRTGIELESSTTYSYRAGELLTILVTSHPLKSGAQDGSHNTVPHNIMIEGLHGQVICHDAIVKRCLHSGMLTQRNMAA